jgi:hypothetical protein
MCRIEGAAARDEIDGPDAKFVADKGAHERTRVCRKYVYAVIREPRDEPVGIKRNGGHDTAIGVEHGDAVGAKAAAAALPVDYC